MTTHGYTARQAAEITGVTYRQLDYWARTNLIRPTLTDAQGSGTRRRYAHRDLILIATIRALLHAGVRHEPIRTAIPLLADLDADHLASAVLIINGHHAYITHDGPELLNAIRSTRGAGAMQLLSIATLIITLDQAVDHSRARP